MRVWDGLAMTHTRTIQLGRLLLCILCGLWMPVLLEAAALDEARTHYDAGRFSEAYESLLIELDSVNPEPAAVALALESLLAQGRILKAGEVASRRVETIHGDGADAIRANAESFYYAGRVAELTGDRSRAVSRYGVYISHSTGKSDTRRNALLYLLEHEPTFALYRSYVSLAGRTPDTRLVGADVAQQQLRRGFKDFADLTRYLLQLYPSAFDARRIIPRLQAGLDARELSEAERAALDKLMRPIAARESDDRRDWQEIHDGLSRWVANDIRFEILCRVQESSDRLPLETLRPHAAAAARLEPDRVPAAAARLCGYEPIYSATGSPQIYAVFLDAALGVPAAFRLSPEQIQGFLATYRRLGATGADLDGRLAIAVRSQGANIAARRTVMEPFRAVAGALSIRALLDGLDAEARAAEVAWVMQARPAAERVAVDVAHLPMAIAAGEKEKVKAAVTRILGGQRPLLVHLGALQASWLGATQLTVDERVSALRAAFATQAVCPALSTVLASVAFGKAGVAEWEKGIAELKDSGAFKALLGAYQAALAERAAVDPARQHWEFLAKYPGQRAVAKIAATGISADARAFLKSIEGVVPGSAAQATNSTLIAAWEICEQHRREVAHDAAALGEWGRTWVARLATGPTYQLAAESAVAAGMDLAASYAAAIERGAAMNPKLLWRLAGMDQLGVGLPYFIPVPTAALHEKNLYQKLIPKRPQWRMAGGPEFFADLMWQYAQSGVEHTGEFDRIKTMAKCHWQYVRIGNPVKQSQVLAAILAEVEREATSTRINYLNLLIDNSRDATDDVTLQRLPGLYHELNRFTRPRATVFTYVRENLDYWQKDPEAPEDKRAAAATLDDAVVSQIILGLGSRAEVLIKQDRVAPARVWLLRNIGQNDWRRVSERIVPYASLAIFDGLPGAAAAATALIPDRFNANVVPVLDALEANGGDELSYVLLGALGERGAAFDWLSKTVNERMERIASGLDIIPVHENDPMYPLHKAARAMKGGSTGQAWLLTRGHLDRLTANWKDLNRDYVVWALEQMRKRQFYEQGVALASDILLAEGIDSADRAAVSLIRGDLFRDLRNYDAARIEYQALRDNKEIADSEAARQAHYRIIEMMIDARAYDNAEPLLERLLDAPDADARAEAWFLKARIAFLQEDYEGSKQDIDHALSLAPAHAEALLLDGELRLHRERGLEEVEIRLGEKQLRRVLVPGRPLRLTLADRSLVIARHGKQVPVLVTTDPGGDRERLVLFPSAGNKTSFSGVLSTQMGPAERDSGRIDILGNDRIRYEIAPDFRAQFKLEYGPKDLEVKSDAKLVASAGMILSEAQLERLRMERTLGSAMNRREGMQREFSTTVRPGNPIYVQVSDKDRNVSVGADKVQVNVETSSGDKLRVDLEETTPMSAVFRGEITSGIPFARASVSDSVEGNDPNAVISSVREGRWESEADGVAPKWIQIDTMTSHEVGSAMVALLNAKDVSRVGVKASLSGAPQTIAEFPEPEISDQLWLQAAPLAAGIDVGAVRACVGGVPPMFGRHLFQRKTGTVLKKVADPGVQPADVVFDGHEGGVAVRLSGVFHVSGAIERSIRCEGLSTTAWARILIDEEIVFERRAGEATGLAGVLPVAMPEGAHSLELLLVSPEPLKQPVVPGWQADTFEPFAAAWFSVATTPLLAKSLSPNATIARTETGFTLSMRDPRRYRKMEWDFEAFEGLQIAVSATEIRDSTNGVVIPVAQDFTMGLRNDVLEIASGDRVTLSYHDEKRLSEENPLLVTTLDAAYANGTIALAMEVVRESSDGEKDLSYYEVQRCRRGDTLQVLVTDLDEDQSAKSDTIELVARTASGEQVVLTAIEDNPANPAEGEDGIHTGRFRAVLRLGDATGGHTIMLNAGELLTVSYLDKENLDPGVPVRRESEVVEAGSSTPALFIIPQNMTMGINGSPEAAASLARLLRKSYNRGRTNLQVWATAPMNWYGDIAEKPEELWLPDLIMRQRYRTSLDARLQIRVIHPAAALHAQSQFRHVKIVTQAEREDAAADGREPRERKLSLRLMDMGNGIFGTSLGFEIGHEAEAVVEATNALAGEMGAPMEPGTEMTEEAMLEESDADEIPAMTGDGSPEMESSRYRVLVSADDVIHLRIDDSEGNPMVEKEVEVASDAFVELLERSFVARDRYVHLGEAFHVRVRDTDQDRTADRDTIQVKAQTASGRSVEFEISETFARSGIFEGKLLTAPLRVAPPAAGQHDETVESKAVSLMVLPGEEVSMEYNDVRNVSVARPRAVKEYGSVRHGADGGIAAFSKRFEDAEMAVKTSFLMAESLFEMAKDQRKLRREDKASALIAQGREVLEEALRDFPETSLVVRGEFLLANLAEELGQYDEAIRRYSDVSSSWPDSEYAPRALFKKALCLEKQGEPEQALEEYVRLTYLYKRHDLAADAVVRLASYYYKQKRYEISAEIFTKFQHNNPEHRLAAKALTLAGLSHMKGEAFDRAMEVFEAVVQAYPDEKAVRSEAMYWLGDSAIEARAYADAYRAFKQLTWDYPETKWAKMARGRMTENVLLNAADTE